MIAAAFRGFSLAERRRDSEIPGGLSIEQRLERFLGILRTPETQLGKALIVQPVITECALAGGRALR